MPREKGGERERIERAWHKQSTWGERNASLEIPIRAECSCNNDDLKCLKVSIQTDGEWINFNRARRRRRSTREMT